MVTEKKETEYYRLVVNNNIDMIGKIDVDVGTLEELSKNTGFFFLENDDDERPYLVYSDEKQMENDPDGRYAIGYLTDIQVVE